MKRMASLLEYPGLGFEDARSSSQDAEIGLSKDFCNSEPNEWNECWVLVASGREYEVKESKDKKNQKIG